MTKPVKPPGVDVCSLRPAHSGTHVAGQRAKRRVFCDWKHMSHVQQGKTDMLPSNTSAVGSWHISWHIRKLAAKSSFSRISSNGSSKSMGHFPMAGAFREPYNLNGSLGCHEGQKYAGRLCCGAPKRYMIYNLI